MITKMIRELHNKPLRESGASSSMHNNCTLCRLLVMVACVGGCHLSSTSLTAQGKPAAGSYSLKAEKARTDQTTVNKKPLQGEISGSGQKATVLNAQAAAQIPTSTLQAQTALTDHNPLAAQMNRNTLPAKIDDFSFQDTLKKLNAIAQAKKQPLSGSVHDQSSGFIMYANKGAPGSPWFAFHPFNSSERQAAIKNLVPPSMSAPSK